MADFINTIDALGDEAVADSIIDRSIVEFKDDKLTSIGAHAFDSCKNMTIVDLPNVTSVYAYAFNGCTALKSVDFPLVFVAEGAFKGCSSLKNVNLQSLPAVGVSSFAGCAFVELYAPKLTSTAVYSFNACQSLVKADFPVISNLGFGTFRDCVKLRALILRNATTVCTLPETEFVFMNTPISSGDGYIYVPRALLDSYKAATNWSNFAAQFRALEDYTVDGTTTGALDESKI